MRCDLHDSIFVGLFHILIIAVEHLKWTNLCRRVGKAGVKELLPLWLLPLSCLNFTEQGSKERNWGIGSVGTWDSRHDRSHLGNRVMEKSGSWERQTRWSVMKVYGWVTVHPFASVLLGITFASTLLVTKAAIHIQFSFCVRIVRV